MAAAVPALLLLLLLLLLHGCASNTIDPTSYWSLTSSRGFLPQNKALRRCRTPSLQPLCQAMDTAPSNSAKLISAAMAIDLNQVLSADDEGQLHDAHAVLAMAACRLGYNSNPTAKPLPEGVTLRLPSPVSIPLLHLAQRLRREPLVAYSSMVLDNCLDRSQAAAASLPSENCVRGWCIQRTMTATATDGAQAHAAEVGFYAAHCEVEAAFAPAKTALLQLQELAAQPGAATRDITEQLRQAADLLRQLPPVLKRMRAFIHPDSFLSHLRDFLKCGQTELNPVLFEGLPAPVIIELVDGQRVVNSSVPHRLRGPSGAMTTTLAFVDRALGIETSVNADPSLAATMREFRRFQPYEHAAGTDALFAQGSQARRAAVACHAQRLPGSPTLADPCAELVDAYDDAVAATAEFRTAHVDHIVNFIIQALPPAVPLRQVTGTGGTPIVSYLCRAALGTLDAMVNGASAFAPRISLPAACVAFCLMPANVRLPACAHLHSVVQRTGLDVAITDREAPMPPEREL